MCIRDSGDGAVAGGGVGVGVAVIDGLQCVLVVRPSALAAQGDAGRAIARDGDDVALAAGECGDGCATGLGGEGLISGAPVVQRPCGDGYGGTSDVVHVVCGQLCLLYTSRCV